MGFFSSNSSVDRLFNTSPAKAAAVQLLEAASSVCLENIDEFRLEAPAPVVLVPLLIDFFALSPLVGLDLDAFDFAFCLLCVLASPPALMI
jgi:hypothetical protein